MTQQKEEVKPIEQFEELEYFIRRQAAVQVLRKKGIKKFFPIQYETFDAINYGSDIIGRDRTGSGKTIAYSLPILQRLRDQQLLNNTSPNVKFLIILPTRELAIQVTNEIQTLKIHANQFRVVTLYGGQPIHPQINSIQRGVDIITATPGRLIDILDRKAINLQQIQSVCLDQADQMLKQGFQEDVEKIFEIISKNCPRKSQKLLFSATVPRWVQQLSNKFMSKNRKFVDLIKSYDIKTPTTIEHICLKMDNSVRTLNQVITNLITIYAGAAGSVIIFCETKREANDLGATLNLKQCTNVLHGDIPQHMREETFKNFKSGFVRCLIATNVAARGLDIPSVDLIVQLQPPRKVDDYVHRAGRTGRAGKNGVCVTFYNSRSKYLMSEIEKMAKITFKHIAEPKNIDILRANCREVINKIKSIDEGVADYFQDFAKQLITEMGAQKALSLAIAQISGVKLKIQECSMQTKEVGFVTYNFSTEGETISSKDLLQFLSCRLQRFGEQDVYHVNQLSKRSIVFDVRENLKKKIQQVLAQIEKKDNLLESIFRLRLVTNEEMISNFADEEIEFTAEEYENAVFNRQNLEVVVRGLSYSVDEDMLFKFFRNSNIKIVQVKLLRDDMGSSRGLAFVLCLNQTERGKALGISNLAVLEGRTMIVDIPRKR